MYKLYWFFAFFYLLLAISGCANTTAITTTNTTNRITVTYHSDPQGATLYEDNTLVGYTPKTVQYNPDENFKQGNCMIVKPLMVRWASGAEASIDPLNLCGTVGYNQQYVFVRPKDVPGRETDVQFSLQLQQIQMQKDANLIRMYNAIQQNTYIPPLPAPQLPRSNTIRCTTQTIGGTTYTNCN